MQESLAKLQQQVQQLSKDIDAQYAQCFSGLTVTIQPSNEEGQPTTRTFDSMDEASFAQIGRAEPGVMTALLAEKEEKDAAGWRAFQAQVRPLKLRRGQLEREAQELSTAISEAAQIMASKGERAARGAAAAAAAFPSGTAAGPAAGAAGRTVRVVLVTGFESFNVDLYTQAAARVKTLAPNIQISVFSDRDVTANKEKVATALDGADIFFGSLLFDYDQVEWLRERVMKVPVRLVFESALELMGCTKVGSFNMAPGAGGEKKGPPPVVKKVLSLFGSQREEDKMVGYLSFLKIGPSLLKWVPGQKAADLRNWLTVYSYWNQGGLSNVVSMFLYLVDAYAAPLPKGTGTATAAITAPVETPALGCLHPQYQGGKAYFTSPADYMKWYQREGPLRGTDAPIVGVLLYRKHVITEQPYIMQLVELMEQEGVIPVPIFINGVEAHTVVRDLLTTAHEQALIAKGQTAGISPTLKRDAIKVDAVVSTIGFPLVGGPAGTMEGGRQSEVAKAILAAKDVPYVVAAPLLIQDMASWSRDGVAGLQSVVLYSLPELDGAIDTVPLGGLCGNNIFLVPERVRKLAGRLRKWVGLRKKPASERKVAILVYGFPPGVGATGTAALLNVPKSLESLLAALHNEGYDLGKEWGKLAAAAAHAAEAGGAEPMPLGEAVVAALKAQEEQRAVSRGAPGVNALGSGQAAPYGIQPGAAEVSASQLKEWLTYPPDWGPTEWGPIPFLPDNDILVQRMEKQWGELRGYRGIMTSAAGNMVIPGLSAGNVFVGVQPLLGLEGDPMRLLFERDLTPHPQYAAFYKWLQHGFGADVVLHFGMHGTVEWLPGAPLGNTGFSWSDVLLGELPNVYVYACNNPSESIVAKRRGYGTIVSHNVPPYGRAGLYKQLAQLKDLISEYRETLQASGGHASSDATAMAGAAAAGAPATATSATAAGAAGAAGPKPKGAARALIAPILELMRQAGLQEDVPFIAQPGSELAARAAARAAKSAPPAPPPGSKALTGKAGAGGKKQQPAQPAAAPGGATIKTERPANAIDLDPEDADFIGDRDFEDYVSNVYMYLQTLENRLFSEGLHVLGAPPSKKSMSSYLTAYFDGALPDDALDVVADMPLASGLEEVRERLERAYRSTSLTASTSAPAPASTPANPAELAAGKLEEAVQIRNLLARNTEELSMVLHALAGGYVLPEAGGDLLRDGAGVLPTGRNIHALDPYRMPSAAAMERGAQAAQAILDAHREANSGAYPETVAINLWGLDAIKTKGESVAMVLHMVGAVPVKEGTGRIARFELVPLEELGRPRVDVLCNMSGIFRDSFQNVVELLDDLFQRAAAAKEPAHMNFIHKHAKGMEAKGLSNPAARLFSNPAGDYGSMVNERVGQGNWEDGDELGDTWAARNAFSFGRGGERGAARPEVLKALLSTTERVIQEVDSVEYGLTDIQEYYANTGALKRAAQVARGGKAPSVSIIEAFGKDTKPRELEDVLRLEYRSKLLNPRWARAMADQGSGGAYEISQRMTAMVGWGATAGFSEGWVWDQAAGTYALDQEMAAKLRKNNPQAFANVLKRMLEAAGRGMWEAKPEVIQKLRELYSEMDDELEGVAKRNEATARAGEAASKAAAAAAKKQ